MLDRETRIIPVIRYVQKVLTYFIQVIRYVIRETNLIPVIRYVQKVLTRYACHKVCYIE